MSDLSNGYERVAAQFLAGRGRASATAVGAREVRAWAGALPPGAAVIDIGCGPGLPLTSLLVSAGLKVYAVDAAPSMVAAFQRNLPGIPVVCEPVQSSTFFNRTFDGILSWGLMFLLLPEDQQRLIQAFSALLLPGGRLLFTSPAEVHVWNDVMTGLESHSLGAAAYRQLLADAGLAVTREYDDVGQNHYFDAVKDLPQGQRA